MTPLSLDGALWRRLARWGSNGPGWFVRAAPPMVGLVVCALAVEQRRAIARNLRRVRGRRGAFRDVLDVGRTFTTYAACLAEVLGPGSTPEPRPEAVIWGEQHIEDALADGRGVIFATAHTAGWEAMGHLLSRDHALRVMIAEVAERDAVARRIQDDARRAGGLVVVHVGDDPLSALPLAKHLRGGGVVALHIDRAPRGARSRRIAMFGESALVPEGPLRLAALTGAPIVPMFSSRIGHHRYEIVARPPVRLVRASGETELDAAAQRLGDALTGFVRAHPTQWFHFKGH